MLTKVSGTVPLPFEETDGLSNPESPDPREAWGHWGMKGGGPYDPKCRLQQRMEAKEGAGLTVDSGEGSSYALQK